MGVIIPKYRVSTSLSDYDFDNAWEAKAKFEALKERASLWKRYTTKQGRVTLIGHKWKRYQNGRNIFFDYRN